ncbi:hypothetical protein Ccrd_000626 [Cynara cardunculus var. scolymus]|uniref:Uncharacterized protein n=1 Tax=Cynara cardunculus var. scolymus TaxID=59895 RepID=A0A118JY58_CYNCS|nr:hypothetical protein Ccrd_000626 [Cynara cardunculus var. scolymus]
MQLYNSIAKGLREVDTRLQRYYKVIVCMNMMMRPMNPPPFQPIAPAPWFPPLPPLTSSFWNATNVHGSLKELQNTLELAEAMEKELEMLITIKGGNQHLEQTEDKGCETAMGRFLKLLENNRITLDTQEKISVEAANALMAKLKNEVEPFKVISDDKTPWEEKSTAVRLANKMQKHKRNKLWRKRKRRRIGEMIAKVELEQFEQADQEADEWRASEIAKEIAGRHFLPEEDNKFLERIRAAVEEEERQAMAAADTGAAKEAIATAEESRNITSVPALNSEDQISVKDGDKASQEKITEIEAKGGSSAAADTESRKQESQVPVPSRGYDYSASLPLEFYHYYHGSSTDMGTLIEAIEYQVTGFNRPHQLMKYGHLTS